MLPDNNSNKIPKKLRGIMLDSHLCGRAKDLCQEIPFEQISSEDGCDKICKALHKGDALCVFSTVYSDFETYCLRSVDPIRPLVISNPGSRLLSHSLNLTQHLLCLNLLWHSCFWRTVLLSPTREYPSLLLQLPFQLDFMKICRTVIF